MDVAAFLIAVVTLLAGLAAGWALARLRSSVEVATAGAQLASAAAERDATSAERDRLRSERETLDNELRAAELRVQALMTKMEALEDNDAQLKDTFARVSSEALDRSTKQFLELADSRLKQAGAPLTETLSKVEGQLREIEKSRVGAQEALSKQIEFVRTSGDELRRETAALVSALRKPQARGRWGELQLRRCVELAGMTDRCDFFEQSTVTTAEGMLRPDLVIRLVGGKSIVVDSKVTLSAYLEAYEAADDDTRANRLEAHAKHLRQHVNELAAKSYWSQFSPAPEFVVLFVPGDAFLAAALDNAPGLMDEAFEKRVHIATPTTLISTLRAVAYAWQQEALATNARQVFDLGRELYKRLGKFGEHMDKLGLALNRGVAAYNGAVGSLEKQVLVSARRLNELEVVDGELKEPTPIEEPVRLLAAPELLEAADESRTLRALSAPTPEADRGDHDLVDRAADYGLGDGEADEGPSALKA
ncbi:MAG TPA: DNA recombination protein RmuC [Mycobacteriales bacterium]|nr:DNA recombination protein RmuC [Mycobacteriales bacterium]